MGSHRFGSTIGSWVTLGFSFNVRQPRESGLPSLLPVPLSPLTPPNNMSDAESETSAPETDAKIVVPPKKRAKQEKKKKSSSSEGDDEGTENKSPSRKKRRLPYGEKTIEGMSTLEMITEAIEYLADRKGVSARTIRHYILTNSKSVREGALKNLMKKALTKALAQDMIRYAPGHDEKLSLLNSKYVMVPAHGPTPTDRNPNNKSTRAASRPQPKGPPKEKVEKVPKKPKIVTEPTRKSTRH